MLLPMTPFPINEGTNHCPSIASFSVLRLTLSTSDDADGQQLNGSPTLQSAGTVMHGRISRSPAS